VTTEHMLPMSDMRVNFAALVTLCRWSRLPSGARRPIGRPVPGLELAELGLRGLCHPGKNVCQPSLWIIRHSRDPQIREPSSPRSRVRESRCWQR
jgi:hypothetical protein